MYSKLLKQMLGLGNFCKNTPLFQAVMMQKISDITVFDNLTLFSNILTLILVLLVLIWINYVTNLNVLILYIVV